MSDSRSVVAYNILLVSEAARVAAALQRRGFQVIVIKGGCLVETVYTLAERPMEDIDILIRATDFDRVHDALHEIGAPRREERLQPVSAWEYPSCAYVTRSGAPIDLHTGLGQPGRWTIDYAGMFRRAVPMRLHGVDTWRLCNEDLLLSIALNQATDEYATDARAAKDVRRVVEALPIDWDATVARARRWRCSVAAWLTFEHARLVAAAAVPEAVQTALRPSPWRERYVRSLVDPAAVPAYRYERHTRRQRQILLAGALTDSPGRFAYIAARFAALRVADRVATWRERR